MTYTFGVYPNSPRSRSTCPVNGDVCIRQYQTAVTRISNPPTVRIATVLVLRPASWTCMWMHQMTEAAMFRRSIATKARLVTKGRRGAGLFMDYPHVVRNLSAPFAALLLVLLQWFQKKERSPTYSFVMLFRTNMKVYLPVAQLPLLVVTVIH